MSAAIVDVCVGRPPILVDGLARASFVPAVRHHRVAPLAHVLLRPHDPDLAAELKPDRDAAMSKHLGTSVVLDGLHTILDGIDWAVVKGPVLSEHAHPAPGLRTYTDVDVLVAPSALRDVTARFLDAGWNVIDYHDMLINPGTPGEMHWVSPSGMLIDLHWSVINMASTRSEFTVPTDELLARRVQLPVGLSSAWTLADADAVAHVGLHAALTGAHRMLLILDVDQLARRVTDWDELVTRAVAWGAAPALGIVLARARTLLQTPLPSDIHRALGITPGLRAALRTVDRLWPVPTLREEASPARFMARSARSTSARTWAAIGRRSLRGIANRLPGGDQDARPAQRRPASLESLETYLRQVETQAGATP